MKVPEITWGWDHWEFWILKEDRKYTVAEWTNDGMETYEQTLNGDERLAFAGWIIERLETNHSPQ